MPVSKTAVPLAVYHRVFLDIADHVALNRLSDGVYLDVNPGFERFSGYSRAEAIGRSSTDLGLWLSVADRQAYLAAIGQADRAGPHACCLRLRDGTLREVEMSGSVIEHGGEHIVVTVVHDVTERNRAQAELAAYRANLEQLVARRTQALDQAEAALTVSQQQAQANARQARFDAQHDALTGLPNRLLLADRLAQAISRAQRGEQALAVLLLDLHHFRRVNDGLGHRAGDELLRQVATRLRSRLRKADTIARVAGDQFVVALSGSRVDEDAAKVAQSVLALLAPPIETAAGSVDVQACIGVAVYPRDGQDGDALLRAADIALLQAKAVGSQNVQFHCVEMQQAAQRRLQLEAELHTALATGQFCLHYQPQVDMRTGRVLAVEALVRWQHPQRGMVPPLEFISLAEETGLIVPLGEWVLREAAQQLVRWRRVGHADLRMAVNLSPRQIWAADFVEMVRGVLAETGLPGGALDVEITESLLIRPTADNVSTFDRLAGLGLHLFIDDFGTGYSSLSYLKSYPIHALKIDRAFVRNICESERDRAITATIIAMARNLHLEVMAEGVETAEQARLLLDSGCTQAQGFHFGRPMPAEALTPLLARQMRPSAPTGDADRQADRQAGRMTCRTPARALCRPLTAGAAVASDGERAPKRVRSRA